MERRYRRRLKKEEMLKTKTKTKNKTNRIKIARILSSPGKEAAQQEAGIQRGEWKTTKSGLPAAEEKSTRF